MAEALAQDKHAPPVDAPDRAGRSVAAVRAAALWAPIAFGLGVQIYFLAPAEPSVAALAGAALAALALATLPRRAGLAVCLAAAALAGLALGFSWAGARARLVAAPVIAAETEALVEGRIVQITQSAAGRPRLTLDRVRVWGLAPEATPERVRVTLASDRAPEARVGDRVSALATLRPPGGPVEPGGYDFARAAWFDGLGGIGVARSRLALLPREPAETPWVALRLALDGARADVSGWLRAGIGGEAGAFAAAIVVGDRAALPVEALVALRDSNLAHLLSISGLHMAIVCGLVFGTVRLTLAASGLALRLNAKKLAAAAGLAGGLAYFAISGAETATQRAFVMAVVALIAVIADRPALTLRALAIAAAVVLAVAPESLLDVGFQMSFAATLALIAAYAAARERGLPLAPGPRAGVWRKIALGALALVATSAVAGLATAPFAAFHFNRASSYGLVANLLGVPAMGMLAAPALVVAGLLAPFGLDGPALKAAGLAIDWILAVARWTAGLPGSARDVAAVSPLALWLVVAGGLLLCVPQGRARALGIAPLAVAGALWLTPAERPAILLSADGAVAVATPLGRAVDAPPGSDFAVEGWLRRDGGAAAAPFARQGRWSLAAAPDGWRVAISRDPEVRPRELAQVCAPMTLVVAPRARLAPKGDGPALLSGGCVALDRERLRHGALALKPDGAALTITPAGAEGRIWSAR